MVVSGGAVGLQHMKFRASQAFQYIVPFLLTKLHVKIAKVTNNPVAEWSTRKTAA